MESFEALTGARTGMFEIEFEEVECEEIEGPLIAINWADRNSYYCKLMFENVGKWGGIKSVEACLNGDQCGQMTRAGGATWTGCPQGEASSMTLRLTQESPSGEEEIFECSCPGSWPWDPGFQCECPGNFGM